MLCLGCAAESVVCGAADIPITPPVSATARSTSSGFILAMSQTARAPAYVKSGPVGGVRQVDGQAELVHPGDGPVAERGQPAVGRLGEAAAERVRVGVRDPDLPQPEAVQHVEAVELVL